MAFSATNWETGPKADTRYVQWMVAAITATKDSYDEVFYPMHRCTDDDFEQFFPIVEESA